MRHTSNNAAAKWHNPFNFPAKNKNEAVDFNDPNLFWSDF